jgi:carboxyl-terminal processing protease
VKFAKFEGYYDDAKDEFEALKTKLTHNLSKELDKNRTIIQRLIEQDIITAYYFQRGNIASAIQHDKQVKKAVEFLEQK